MIKAWALALALGALAVPAMGEEAYRLGRWEMSLAPAWAIPLGGANDLMRTSLALQATGGYQFHPWLTAGLELGWQFNHHLGGVTAEQIAQDFDRDGLVDRVPFSSNIREKIFQMTPFIKAGQWLDVTSYKFRPYLLLGGGLYHVWTNSGLITVAGRDQVSGKNIGPIYQTYDTSSNSYFGFNTGAGFEVQVDENAAVGFDLRFSRVVKPYEDLEFLTPSLRIMYLF